MADRYFVSEPIVGEEVLLAGPEARHLAQVMRAKPGDRATLFDGSGVEFWAEVVRVGRNEVQLRVLETRRPDRELPFDLTLAVALPKGERQRWLVEKAVELGVTRLVPLETARSVALAGDQTLERLGRAVIEASKQCGRNRLMEIGRPCRWAELVETDRCTPIRLLADPSGEPMTRDALSIDVASPAILVAIGPEGGFTGEELALARSSAWRVVSLGARVLRTETAALALAAILAAR